MKRWVADFYAAALYGAGWSRPERTPPDSLLILTFHRVLPPELREQYPLPGLAVTPAELDWVLAALVPHFDVRTVSDAYRALRAGEADRALLAVTFDDGCLDNLEYGAPVLRRHEVAATFYIPTGFIGARQLLWHDAVAFAWRAAAGDAAVLAALADQGIELRGRTPPDAAGVLALLKNVTHERRTAAVDALFRATAADGPQWARLMTWEQVAQLAGDGHEIGSHGRDHSLLPKLAEDQQAADIAGSRDHIASILGSPPRSFCYPNGDYDERTLRLTAAAGYTNAVTTQWGRNDRNRQPHELLRCDIDARRLTDRNGALSLARLALRLSGYQPGLSGR